MAVAVGGGVDRSGGPGTPPREQARTDTTTSIPRTYVRSIEGGPRGLAVQVRLDAESKPSSNEAIIILQICWCNRHIEHKHLYERPGRQAGSGEYGVRICQKCPAVKMERGQAARTVPGKMRGFLLCLLRHPEQNLTWEGGCPKSWSDSARGDPKPAAESRVSPLTGTRAGLAPEYARLVPLYSRIGAAGNPEQRFRRTEATCCSDVTTPPTNDLD